jgi:hypothetical protein
MRKPRRGSGDAVANAANCGAVRNLSKPRDYGGLRNGAPMAAFLAKLPPQAEVPARWAAAGEGAGAEPLRASVPAPTLESQRTGSPGLTGRSSNHR